MNTKYKINKYCLTIIGITFLIIINANLYAIERSFLIGSTNLPSKMGETNGVPINSGFVFYDGEYIEAPYVVSRKGLSIYINDKLISYCKVHPKRKKYTIDEDPGLPEGVTSTTTENEICKHLAKKQTYLFDVYAENEARTKMLEYYRQLPCIESVTPNTKFVGNSHFDLKYNNGEIIHIGLGGRYAWDEPEYSDEIVEEVLAKRIEKKRRNHEKSLIHETTYFVQSKDSTFCLSPRKTDKDLKLAIEIIRSDRTYDQKMTVLRRMDICPPGGMDVLSLVVSNFQSTAQFDTRLQQTIQKSKYIPRIYSDIPEEAPADRRKREREEVLRKAREEGY